MRTFSRSHCARRRRRGKINYDSRAWRQNPRRLSQVAETMAISPLVKTALAAGDANVGRFLMAIGNAGDGFSPQKTTLSIGKTPSSAPAHRPAI